MLKEGSAPAPGAVTGAFASHLLSHPNRLSGRMDDPPRIAKCAGGTVTMTDHARKPVKRPPESSKWPSCSFVGNLPPTISSEPGRKTIMDETRTCPSCGKALPADAPQGICPECLMKAGFGTASGTEGGGDARFVPPPVETLAKLFPQLELLGLIGQGGMGAVYKARQPGLDRLVALKILPPRPGSDPGFAERFTREARALARLNHPNIVAVYDFGQVSGAGVSPANVQTPGAGVSPASAPAVPPAAPPTASSPSPQPFPSLHYFLMEYVDGPNL